MIELDDVTVLIPLHRSGRFEDVVAGNLQRLSGVAHLVVSDGTEEDDALLRLRRRFGEGAGISWLGARPEGVGWVDHCNDLAARVPGGFFMWLPHDDDIDAEYLRACRAAFDDEPALGAVLGRVECVEGEGYFPKQPRRISGIEHLTEYRYAANAYVAQWNPGFLFRALCRVESFEPLPHTTARDDWSDSLWGYGLALRVRVRQLEDVVYWKRYYESSTHAGAESTFLPAGLPSMVDEVRRRLPDNEHEVALRELAQVVAQWMEDRMATLDLRSERLQVRTSRLEARLATSDARLRDAETRLAAARDAWPFRAAGLLRGWRMRIDRQRRRGH